MPEFTRSEARQWALERLRGLYSCPFTPFTDDGELDVAAVHHNVERFVELGLNGLVVGGFIAEGWNMTLAGWCRYHEVVAEAVAGRMDLWTIILDASVHQALERMAFVERLGYSGAEVINPVVQLRTDDEIHNWFKYLTDHSDLAICLYRTPVSGKVLGWDLMRRLAELDTVVACKQGSFSRAETLKLRRELGAGFIVSDPLETFWLDELRHGGQVLWGELSYLLYGRQRHHMDAYMRLAAERRWQEAYDAWAALAPVRALYEDLLVWDVLARASYTRALARFKVWFEAVGFRGGPFLPPLALPPPPEREALRARLAALGVV